MNKLIKIKKGLDIRLAGMPASVTECFEPPFCALKPSDFIGVTPKMHVKEGDNVLVGTVLFHDKNNEHVVFTSPVSGTVKTIARGEKHAITHVIIENDSKNDSIDFGKAEPTQLSRNELITKLLQSGIWPLLRQRPFATIANPDDTPKHIFISMFDTAPLAPDNDYIIENQLNEFKTGVKVLARLTSGNVYINMLQGSKLRHELSEKEENVVVTEFSGPHPAGNVGTQINALSPINKGETVWYCYPQDVVTIGKLFLTGRYDSSRTFALTGSEVKTPRYFTTKIGADISSILEKEVSHPDKNVRVISGNVLTGNNITNDNFLYFHDTQVTVIPEGNEYRLFGWLAPNRRRFTSTNTMLSSFFKKQTFTLDTNRNGDTRPYVMTGDFEKVFPFDVYPMQLIKACIIKDIEQMEELGIYEIDSEDFALCEVIDPSKTPIQKIIREGLELLRKETI